MDTKMMECTVCVEERKMDVDRASNANVPVCIEWTDWKMTKGGDDETERQRRRQWRYGMQH